MQILVVGRLSGEDTDTVKILNISDNLPLFEYTTGQLNFKCKRSLEGYLRKLNPDRNDDEFYLEQTIILSDGGLEQMIIPVRDRAKVMTGYEAVRAYKKGRTLEDILSSDLGGVVSEVWVTPEQKVGFLEAMSHTHSPEDWVEIEK